jgi:hypothetical protein
MDPGGENDSSPPKSSRKRKRIERQEQHTMHGEDPLGAVTMEQLKVLNMKARISLLEAATVALLLPVPVVDADAAATIESERAPVTSSTAAAEFGNGCRICFDAVETEVLIPCGHKGACKQCIQTIVREGYESARKVPLCPVCRCVLIGPYCVTPYEM